MKRVTLLDEDFSDFAIGDFPHDPRNSAMGEYHYYPPKGYQGRWYCPITDPGWQGPMWIVTREGDRKCMESCVLKGPENDVWNMLTAGDEDWQDYDLELEIRMLSTATLCGVAFRYQNSRCFYALCFAGGKLQLVRRRHHEQQELAAVDIAYDADHVYHLRIECRQENLRCYLDSELQLETSDDLYGRGRVSLCATSPARFYRITVRAEAGARKRWLTARKQSEAHRQALAETFPRPRLWKRFELADYGAGRSIRFGDLTGNGNPDMLIAQCQKRVRGDNYANISCLTAIDLEGRVVWQRGEPNPKHAFVTADLPFQIADVNLDGKNEVVLAESLQIKILEGSTGRELACIPTPISDVPVENLYAGVPLGRYAFDRVNIDCIRICNFTGKQQPTDILVKDRYSRLWAYTNDLQLLWYFHDGITGHFPYTKDINGDGREEMLVGYNLVDAAGCKLWTLPIHTDHTDEIIIGRMDPDNENQVAALVCGNEGFVLADLEGNILVKDLIGHAQRISAGNYRPDSPGLEIAVTTYWGHQGIVLIYNCRGDRLYSFEPGTNGNIVSPVNWTGDGRDLILLNGNVHKGGMIDGWGRTVVSFPDDGHPDLCAEVIDLTGDCRDEIVLWDEKSMVIYTQDSEFTGERIYRPEKYPHYNASNYRGEYSWPRWEDYGARGQRSG